MASPGYGVLLNVGSILSKVGQPFVPSYVISKFALRGLSEALRAELADCPGIHVCTLLPYAIDTPHFQVGANLVGQKPHAMPPAQSPEHVARELVGLVKRPRRELHVPRLAALGLVLHALFPRPVERERHAPGFAGLVLARAVRLLGGCQRAAKLIRSHHTQLALRRLAFCSPTHVRSLWPRQAQVRRGATARARAGPLRLPMVWNSQKTAA